MTKSTNTGRGKGIGSKATQYKLQGNTEKVSVTLVLPPAIAAQLRAMDNRSRYVSELVKQDLKG